MTIRQAIASNRFGLGASPGELASIGAKPQRWLLDQIAGPSRSYEGLRAFSASSAVLKEVTDLRSARRKARMQEDQEEATIKQYGRSVRNHYATQVLARYQIACSTTLPFHERLVHFWSNHFAVSADKQPLAAIAGLFENEAIRPHINGKFSDMLIAVEQHPAMLVYLDNQQSVGPDSRVGKRRLKRGRPGGLNENLAREILELHTLGVDGGYSQTDVTNFAKMITGWSVGTEKANAGQFFFRSTAHQPGSQTLLGKTFKNTGVNQGIAALHELAVQEATARHLATKLARHFVADSPPGSIVDALTRSYMKSGGELGDLYETLVLHADAWPQQPKKYKSPSDFLISSMRAFNYEPDRARRLFQSLEYLGQAPFRPGSPAGWPDTALDWGGPDALLKRITWSNSAGNLIKGIQDPASLGDEVLGKRFTISETRKAILRAESVPQGITMLLASPEFQRR
ncbi:MAG: DUF1800 domain-containing protein [Pseudomonadota bacterium]